MSTLAIPARAPGPTRLILMLALSPTISLGISRFAYSLVLPDMRDTLGWSYSAAGFMNTVNAAGYLAGALLAARLARKFGLFPLVQAGTLACVVSLALCALSGDFVLLGFARMLAGLGAAVSFVAGGALAATLAQSEPERSSLLLSLFYAGPGLGILISGLASPFLLQALGPGSWWAVWLALAAIASALALPLLVTRIDRAASLECRRYRAIRTAPGGDLSRRLLSVRRRLHRLHDVHDRLCPR